MHQSWCQPAAPVSQVLLKSCPRRDIVWGPPARGWFHFNQTYVWRHEIKVWRRTGNATQRTRRSVPQSTRSGISHGGGEHIEIFDRSHRATLTIALHSSEAKTHRPKLVSRSFFFFAVSGSGVCEIKYHFKIVGLRSATPYPQSVKVENMFSSALGRVK